MRDILLSVIVFGSLPFILFGPRLGAYMWVWMSMMNPHRLGWGFARYYPFAQLIAIATLVGFIFVSKERKPFPLSAITVAYLLFFVWMSVTSLFAIAPSDLVMDRWIFVCKIHLMLLVTLMLIRGRDQIEKLVWVVTLSIGFYGIKGGVWTVLTGGGDRVWGPEGSMIEDNNGLGLAIVMLIPFMYYLYQVSSKRLIRIGVACSGIAMFCSVLGSQSRGAFLALFAMALMLAIKSRRPALMGLLLGAVFVVGFVSMPDSWKARMGTIETHQQDSSAQSRFYSWNTMWNLAVDRPLVGGGFLPDNDIVYSLYAPVDRGYEIFERKPYVAHSIYFQVIGEHGFLGLFLYLLIGFFAWRRAGQLARQTRDDPEFGTWVPVLMRMTQVSVLGFAVGGAFLSLVHFDLSYYIISYVILVDITVREHNRQNKSAKQNLNKTMHFDAP
ncbi:putative O-glycosylation ligase, exosortase A system-associated [Propionivibrio sp.]|uniref:putative O-glycosylation ligase, exosortase A system-associated n=1 Tax=Propionivibrio sp. TaxID=2212460 RepID=UPI003BF11B2A